MRICSFLPAATEIVYALGLGTDLCGVTHECDYPPDARSKPVVIEPLIDSSSMSQAEIDRRVSESLVSGHGLYRIRRDLLERAKPDVLITQELCDVCSVSLRDVLRTVHELSRDCRVVSLRPRGLAGMMEDIVTVGEACGARLEAERLVERLRERVDSVRTRSAGLRRENVFCVEWFDPVFASGHWVPEMVEVAGGSDSLGRKGEDSKRIAWDDVVAYDPAVLVLIPCGLDLSKTLSEIHLVTTRRGWGEMAAVRNGRVYAADGSAYFSRPGPRLVDGVELLAKMIHPEEFGADLPAEKGKRVEAALLRAR